MALPSLQFNGFASAIPNQTNMNADSIFPNLGGGGGGGGPNPVVSTLTFAANTNVFYTSSVTFADIESGGSSWFKIENGGIAGYEGTDIQIKSSDGNAFVYLGAVNGSQGGVITTYLNQPFQIVPPTSISSLSVSSINGAQPGGAIPEDLVVNTVTASTITASTIAGLPKMNWGAINIPASGSTIASVADNPYSGVYYQQLTYRGNIQAGLSSLFASTIDGESFFIYGEPGQQVMFQTIGDN